MTEEEKNKALEWQIQQVIAADIPEQEKQKEIERIKLVNNNAL